MVHVFCVFEQNRGQKSDEFLQVMEIFVEQELVGGFYQGLLIKLEETGLGLCQRRFYFEHFQLELLEKLNEILLFEENSQLGQFDIFFLCF
jgi:hypothetical protein